MTKLKTIFLLLFTLTLVACGSPEPNEPFLGKWSLDKEMTLQKNRGLPADLLSKLRNELQELIFDISDSEVHSLMVTNLNRSDNKRKLRKLFENSAGNNQQDDRSTKREQAKIGYKFSDHTVTIEIEGQKKIITLDFTFIADPVKLTLKSSRDGGVLPLEMTLLREGKYMIYRVPMDREHVANLYFTQEEG